jgi:hypothetical protein
MRKVLTAGLAALTLGGSVLATSTPAAAYPHGGWHGGYHHGWHGGGAGWAVGAGLLGLAAGAAIADSYHPHYYYGGYYAPAYYDDDYAYGYSTCVSHRRVWDPYIGGFVYRTVRYAC